MNTMRALFALVALVLMMSIAFIILMYFMNDAANTLAKIGECQRLTKMSFFECGDLNEAQLKIIEASSTEK